MDTCPICQKEFRRHYLRKGVRQIYCSKACRYAGEFTEKECPTCHKKFKIHRLGVARKDTIYCSLSCNQREPCQVCDKIITGRNKYQGKERRYCGHKCAAIANMTLKSEIKYAVFGYAESIKRHGVPQCNKCGDVKESHLIVHHKDHDRKNNTPNNLEVLCANCHMEVHWLDSKNKGKDIDLAKFVAKFFSKQK